LDIIFRSKIHIIIQNVFIHNCLSSDAITVIPIEVFLKYWFNTLPQVDQFISSSSSRYSYTSLKEPIPSIWSFLVTSFLFMIG
jgi:hypothetical protein